MLFTEGSGSPQIVQIAQMALPGSAGGPTMTRGVASALRPAARPMAPLEYRRHVGVLDKDEGFRVSFLHEGHSWGDEVQ